MNMLLIIIFARIKIIVLAIVVESKHMGTTKMVRNKREIITSGWLVVFVSFCGMLVPLVRP